MIKKIDNNNAFTFNHNELNCKLVNLNFKFIYK